MSEAQFMEALRRDLFTPELHGGESAVLRVRVNAYTATVSLIGNHDTEGLLLLPSGDRLRQCLRASDLVANEKPGTFLILLRNLQSEDELELICERIIRAGKRPFRIADALFHSGFSVGAAMVSDENIDAVSLVRNATAAMFRSLRDGEDGFEIFTHEVAEEYSDPLEMESNIWHALRKDLFELDFQPQYQRDSTLIGAEALVRMQTSGGGRLEGEAFLPWVEDSELIVEMGERVLRQVCFQARDWLRRNVPFRSLSISVAAALFLQKDFPAMVGALLDEAGVPGRLLELELSESTIMTNFEAATHALTGLANLGVRFAQCGVGLGPFPSSYLQRLPIEVLQVSCLSGNLPYAGSSDVLRAIISRGHRLGLQITAKDIQSEAQRTALWTAGCDVFQGPLLSRPLSKEEMELVLLTSSSIFRETV